MSSHEEFVKEKMYVNGFYKYFIYFCISYFGFMFPCILIYDCLVSHFIIFETSFNLLRSKSLSQGILNCRKNNTIVK